ncbi:hypothetical protein [Paenibacillus lactis]|uniref:hypothetical protein n=1 Tax=Paenibacillus lactis TaxID=228574 RepID=UPI00368AE46A
MFTHDHAVYVRQMHDWHMKMAQYHDQLRAFHLERAKQFQKLAEERAKTSTAPLKGEPTWSDVMSWQHSESKSGTVM